MDTRKPGGAVSAAMDAHVAKVAATQSLAVAMPYNANKEAEHGDLARNTPTGVEYFGCGEY